jgi:hypothetical protein
VRRNSISAEIVVTTQTNFAAGPNGNHGGKDTTA